MIIIKDRFNNGQINVYFPKEDSSLPYYPNVVILPKGTNPKFANLARVKVIDELFNKQYEDHTSRLILNDFKNQRVTFEALIADILINKNHIGETTLLLERVNINDGNPYKQQKKKLAKHLWIKLNDINYSETLDSSFTFSIGDRIIGTAAINMYYGKIEHELYGTKFGFKSINLVAVGMTFESKMLPINDYPRFGDWVLKIKSLPSIPRLESTLKKQNQKTSLNLRNKHKLLYLMRKINTTFEVKESNYPHYAKRLHK